MVNDPVTPAGRRIALIAHDSKRQDMLEWARYNLAQLTAHELYATADFVISSHLMNRVHEPWDPAPERDPRGLVPRVAAGVA